MNSRGVCQRSRVQERERNQHREPGVTSSALSPEVRRHIRAKLEHPFDLMLEAVAYRLDQLVQDEVRHYILVPKAEYWGIRIYAGDLAAIRAFMEGTGPKLSYVSFVGAHRRGMEEAIEVVDRALIGRFPEDSPILGYFSLQDPELAWVNLVLFKDEDTLLSWVGATQHAADWATAAALFSEIEKSVGTISYVGGAVVLEPKRLVVRNYDATRLDPAQTG